MKRFSLLIATIFLNSCMTSNGLQYDAVAQTNVYRIARVNKGMSEKEVLQIMKRPYSYESFDFGDDIYDVWFYVTRPTGLDQTRMVPMNLTPLTFRNGVLVGMGYDYYYFLTKEEAKKEQAQEPTQTEKKERETEIENIEFEKALKGPKAAKDSDEELPNYPKNEQKILTPPQSSPQTPRAKISAPVKKTSKEDSLNGETQSSQEKPSSQSKNTKKSNSQTSLAPVRGSEESYLVMTSKLGGRFSEIELGMTQEQVHETVGEPVIFESFAVDNDVYEVWVYDTHPTSKKEGKQALKNMLPLTFKNGVLVGVTSTYYQDVKKRASRLDNEKIQGYDRKGEDLQQDESDQDFNYW